MTAAMEHMKAAMAAVVGAPADKAADAEPGMAEKLKSAQEIANGAVGDVKGAMGKISGLFGKK